MNDTTPDSPASARDTVEKSGESCRARSVRFSDSECETIKQTNAKRGKNAEFGIARGHYGDLQGQLPLQSTSPIEQIFRCPYIMVSLHRVKLIRTGRGDEFDKLIMATLELQNLLIQATLSEASNDAGGTRS